MRRTLLLPAVALLALGCVRKTAPVTQAAMTGVPVRWSGSFQPQQQRTGGLGPTASNRAFGSVSLTPSLTDANRARVQITLTAPVQTGQSLAWGMFPGRCGSGSGMAMPVVAVTTLPPLEVVRSGGAQMDQEIAITLPSGGGYHVNVFWSTRAGDLSDVMTCANLRAANSP